MKSDFSFPPQNPTEDKIFKFPNDKPEAININENFEYPTVEISAQTPVYVTTSQISEVLQNDEAQINPTIINIPSPTESTEIELVASTPKIDIENDFTKDSESEDNITKETIEIDNEINNNLAPMEATSTIPPNGPTLMKENPLLTMSEEYVTNLRQEMATDWRNPSEYALHILFTKFVRYAENKLNSCLDTTFESEPLIVDVLGEGIDLEFDRIIESLGHIAKNKPKPVIDAMMFWRKTKSEIALMAADEVEKLIQEYESEQYRLSRLNSTTSGNANTKKQQSHSKSNSNSSRFSHTKNKSSKSSNNDKNTTETEHLKGLEIQIENAKEIAFQADRKSLISIYILCRVLIDIVKQSPLNAEEDLNDKLEEIVFTQLKTTDPLSISTSIVKSSNWNAFAELLGYMSENKFISVSDRFIADLEKVPKQLTQELEPSVHLLILGMRYIKLKNYPLERFEESADFLKSISKFFAKTTNISVKLAYSEVVSQLLLPMTGSLTAEVNHPTWVETMTSLLNSAMKLQTDDKYWASGFKLAVSVLCASPPELFTKHWLSLIEKNVNAIKSRSLQGRIIFAVSLSRLVWVYLYRCSETLNNTTKRLEKLLGLYLNNQKKKDAWITTDLELINPLCDVLVTIAYLHPNVIMENAMIPLIKQSFNGTSLNNISYENLIMAINTYKGILLTNKRPEFPENDSRYYDVNLNDISLHSSESLMASHEEISVLLHKLFLLLDSNIGSEVWYPENEHQKQSSTQFGPFIFNFSNDNNNSDNRNLNIALFATLIETIPCCVTISNTIPFKSVIEILSRNAVHADLLIATSAQNALKSLAMKENPYILITWFAKYSFDFDEKTQSRYNVSYLASNEYKRLLILYVELLGCWLEEFQSSKFEEKKKKIGLDGIQLPITDSDRDEANEAHMMQWKNTAAVIEEVEGNGLFFLCANDYQVRILAIQILRIISRFDEIMTEKTSFLKKGHSRSSSHFAADRGTRLIDLLSNASASSYIAIQSSGPNDTEKTRLAKLNSRYKKLVLIKLAESDSSVDTALWQKALPKLLSKIFSDCPVTMALCRSIVCIRLVQMHNTILRIADDKSFQPDNASPKLVTDQWKLYLIVACTFLTSTNNQRLTIPKHNDTSRRKKSQQIFTVQHQKIKSATSIFKMVLPLLSTDSVLVKDAIIQGLSSMNVNIYKAYIESVEEMVTTWDTNSSNQVRVEMCHILAKLSNFVKDNTVVDDIIILTKISSFIKSVKQFLQRDESQISYSYQSLRVYFTELLLNYYSAIKDKDCATKLFPFQARTSCFNYLRDWCGFGDHAYIGEERYNLMIMSAKNSNEKAAISSGIEMHKQKFQLLALKTMVCLCSDTINFDMSSKNSEPSLVVSFDTSNLISWIEALLSSKKANIREIGVSALKGLLTNNRTNVKLFKDISVQCISTHKDPQISVLYYSTLCQCLLKMEELVLEEHELVTLGLFGLVAPKEETRINASDLLSVVETKLHNSSFTKVYKERLSNSSRVVYRSTAKEISSMYAELLSVDLCLMIFSNMVRALKVYSDETIKDLLTLLVPWVNKFTLKSAEDAETIMILQNLFFITIEMNNSLPEIVEQLWISLGQGNSFQNIHVSLEYIFEFSMSRKNTAFVQQAMDVVLYLSKVPGSLDLVDVLIENLEPKYMVPTVSSNASIVETVQKKYFVADIWSKLDNFKANVTFSKAQLSVIYLSRLLSTPSESVIPHIPNIFHVSFCLLDHYVPLIQESAAKITSTLIYGLAPINDKSEKVVELLRSRSSLWPYDNLAKDKSGARSPKMMNPLIKQIISIFDDMKSLQEEWQKVALKWATSCSVRHVACRSFQIFRSLLNHVDQNMLRDMIQRLSNTISDENSDIQVFSTQILMTLNAITAELEPAELINFPQLFWSMTASLNSVHEQEFIEVLSCFSKFVSKIDLDSPDTVQCLVAIFPSNWQGRFDGLQQIVMTGLRSANSMDITWNFLNKLNLLKDSRIIANSESRLLFALIANLPRFMNAMDVKEFTEIQDACDSMTSLANAYDQPSLARVMDSLSKDKFRSKSDFVSQIVNFISRNYFPHYAAQTVVFLIGLLLNKVDWVKIQTLEILKFILPLIDFTLPEFIGVGADLISPLLRLLMSEHEVETLEVLDCLPNLSGNKMDKDVLRISMGNKDLKSSPISMATLFGIPDESGWSVPMPGVTAASTRHNVHAVFTTFAKNEEGTELSQELSKAPEVFEFHKEGDYNHDSADSIDSASVIDENDASLSHMWAELDNLDSFFTKTTMNVVSSKLDSRLDYHLSHVRSNSNETSQSFQNSALDSAPQLYDKKVSAILNRSLKRTQSNVSFKTSLIDSFGANTSNENLINDQIYPKSPVKAFMSSTPEITTSRSRTSNILKSPNAVMLNSSKSRLPDSPQDTLFRFEGFLRSSQKNRRKWQYHQQHQQLLSQTIHEQSSASQFESDSSPLRLASSSPVLGLSKPSGYATFGDTLKNSKENNRQSRYQKHYHIPHFSSNKT